MRTVMITAAGLSDLVANADLDPEELTTTLRAMARATPGVITGSNVGEQWRPADDLHPHSGEGGVGRGSPRNGIRWAP